MSKRLMKKLTVLALLSLTVKSGLQKCKTIEQFQQDHVANVITPIDFNAFLQMTCPLKVIMLVV